MNQKTAVFGGGCFWCTEAIYRELKGVLNVQSGYAGGTTPNPTYEQVCTGKTGHAEVIQIDYDEDTISFETLLIVFFGTHDPTTLNRQGADTGTQYRSIILTNSDEQSERAQNFIQKAQADIDAPIVTEVKPLQKFYPAEEDHQNFYANNILQPYCQFVINPKLSKLREKFSALLREQH